MKVGVSKYIKGILCLKSFDFTFEFIMGPSLTHRSLSVQGRGRGGTARTEVPYFCAVHALPWDLEKGQ